MSGKTIGELETLAANGNVDAIQELGVRYYKGIGVGVNYQKAKQCFEKAGQGGCKASNYYLGMMYYNGNGMQTNHAKAKEYFEKSDKDNNIFSTYYLGKIYYWGDGVEKNEAKANEYKAKVLGTPFFANQKAGTKEFYSVSDIEAASLNYAKAIEQKVKNDFQSLYGTNTNINAGTISNNNDNTNTNT